MRLSAPHYCGPREYTARVVLEVAVLLAAAYALACSTWFQHQPISFRAALVTGMAYLSAASIDTLRHQPPSAVAAPTRAATVPNPATDPEE